MIYKLIVSLWWLEWRKNSCVNSWKLWNIMGVNRIMSWKIVDVKIWFDCTSYAWWLCEMEMRMKRPRRRQKWKEMRNEKWKDPREGELRSDIHRMKNPKV